MVRMGACRVPDRGSIPRRGDLYFIFCPEIFVSYKVIKSPKLSVTLHHSLIDGSELYTK